MYYCHCHYCCSRWYYYYQTWTWVGLTHGLGWVGLGRVGSRILYLEWVGLAWVELGQIWFTAKQHWWFYGKYVLVATTSTILIPIKFIFRKFSIIYAVSVPFFVAKLLTVFSNNSRVMINNWPSPMNPFLVRHKWHCDSWSVGLVWCFMFHE